MKNPILNLKCCIALLLFVAMGHALTAQNSEQARSFINRSHIAVAKVQKEMYFAGKSEHEAEIKKAIKLQMTAVALHKDQKYKEALAYSYKSRAKCIELCNLMNISEGAWYSLNDDEKVYCKPADCNKVIENPALLNAAESKKIDELNIMDVQKFHEITLNIK
jgi:hypothetical protein